MGQIQSGSPGKTPLLAAAVERVVDLTLAEPLGKMTRRTGRAMAELGSR